MKFAPSEKGETLMEYVVILLLVAVVVTSFLLIFMGPHRNP